MMDLKSFATAKTRWYARHKLLIWASLISLILSVLIIGEPLDRALLLARYNQRDVPASGQIVIASITDRSVERIGKWPWSNREYARLLQRLDALGARRVFFDVELAETPGSRDDRNFEQALRMSRADVFLSGRRLTDPITGKKGAYLPPRRFARNASIVNVNATSDFLIGALYLQYYWQMGGQDYPTMASVLGKRSGEKDAEFPVDYGLRLNSLPIVDTADILLDTNNLSDLRGRDVVIGRMSRRLGDMTVVGARGPTPEVLVHVAGAETLLRGQPRIFGWIIPFMFAFGLVAWGQSRRGRKLSRLAIPAAIIALLVLPAFLEAQLIFIKVAPSLFLLGIVTGVRGWERIRRRNIMVHPRSGLPSLNALRDDKWAPQTVLIAARVANFADIASALPQEVEKSLVDQIVRRIKAGWEHVVIYQGDEGAFAWLLSTTRSMSISDELEALHLVFRSPVSIGNQQIDLDIAFGVEASGDRLLANRLASALVAADEAHSEGLRWKAYDPSKLESAEWRLSLLSRLDNAIDNGEIWVAFQPILDLKNDQICAAEALARWTHPERGEISPADFIPAAEQHSRIERLTEYVLEQAIKFASSLSLRGQSLTVAVNLSVRLLNNAKIVSTVENLLRNYGLTPEQLVLEVTESAAIIDSETTLKHLEQLRMVGVGISIDDYGTGFSTLEYLKKVPADEIKIDRNFISAMHKSRSDQVLVESTIELAHSLGRRVIAEGLERVDTLAMLETMGCDAVQGYLIARPMTSSQFIGWIDARHNRLVA